MTVWLERQGKMPVTLNAAKKSKRTWLINRELQDWRAWSASQCDGVEPMRTPVTVTVTHLRKNRASMPDVGAVILAAKAVIDGAVDAGVLPDDSPEYVRKLTFEAPEIAGFHGLRVVIREVQA